MASEKTLENMIRELHQVSGFRICIYDTKRTELCAWPKDVSPFCRLIQKDPACLAQCRKGDDKAFFKAQQTKDVVIYRCHVGLYEAVAPLYDRGRLSGYLMMGQTLDTMKQSRQELLQRSYRYVEEEEELRRVAELIPDRSKAQILACTSIMEICASYITLSNRLKAVDADLPHKVKTYLEEHFAEAFQLEDLCQIFYCSRVMLTTSFRRAYQTTIHQYLIRLRLENSLRLLEEKDNTIGEAASRSGFPDQNYFTKSFKKQFGVTPSEYRQTYFR